MPTSQAVPSDAPVMLAWEAYKLSEEYSNTLAWCSRQNGEHAEGSLWAAFFQGFQAAMIKAQERRMALEDFLSPSLQGEWVLVPRELVKRHACSCDGPCERVERNDAGMCDDACEWHDVLSASPPVSVPLDEGSSRSQPILASNGQSNSEPSGKED